MCHEKKKCFRPELNRRPYGGRQFKPTFIMHVTISYFFNLVPRGLEPRITNLQKNPSLIDRSKRVHHMQNSLQIKMP